MTDRERDPAEFGKRLQAAIDERHWSEREMARQSGVNQQTVANMLAGRKANKPDEPYRPTKANIIKIASALGEPSTAWLRLAGYHVPDQSYDQPSPDTVEKLVGKIPSLDRATVEALAVLVDRILRDRGYIAADAPRPEPVQSGVPEPARDGVESLPGSGPVGAPLVHEPSADQRRRSSIDNRRS